MTVAFPRRTALKGATVALAALFLPWTPSESDAAKRRRRCRRWKPLTVWALYAPWPRPTYDLLPVKRRHCWWTRPRR